MKSQIAICSYSWDYRNRLISSNVNSNLSLYGYDQDNLRVLKGNGTATTTYPNKYYNVSGATTTSHIFLPDGSLIATVEGNGEATTTNYVLTDHLGGTNVVTDEAGEVVQALDYYPFGSERISTGQNSTDRHFIGEMFDQESELNYLNARYYSGDRGQFMSQDPVFWSNSQNINNPQSLNSYSYAENNPVIKKDPTGRCPQCLIGAGAGIVGQFGYDIYSNIQAGGVGNAFSNFSSPGTYATRAIQGAIVAGTGGLAGGYFGLSIAGQSVAVGVASGITSAGGNYLLGEPVTTQSVLSDTIIGGLSFGVLQSSPRVPGRLPNFGTNAFFFGQHTQQSAQRLGVETFSGYISQLFGNLGNTYQSRSATVQSYNTSIGASTPQDKIWTVPSGAVVTWGGDLVAGPTAQSTPATIK